MRQLLRDIAEIGAGQGAPQGDSNYCTDGIPFVKAGNMESLTSGGSLNDILKVSERVARDHKLKLYPKGTVLFAKSGMSCLKGYVYVLPQEAYVVSHLACITPKEDISDYLRFYFDYHRPNQLVKDPAYPSISLADIGALEIDTKDAKSRERIISVLRSVEAIIESRKQQLSNLDDLIKARFVEMFGNPVRDEMGWPKRPLKDVCSKLNDGTHFSPESFASGDYKYITAKNIKPGGFDFSNITYVPESVHRPIYERCNPEYGDVLYIKDGVTTGIAMVNTLEEEFTLLSSVALLKQNREIMNGHFLCGILNNNEMYSDIRSNMGGAAITRLTIAKLNGIQVIVPPIGLQNQFATFVAQVDKSKVVGAKRKIE